MPEERESSVFCLLSFPCFSALSILSDVPKVSCLHCFLSSGSESMTYQNHSVFLGTPVSLALLGRLVVVLS